MNRTPRARSTLAVALPLLIAGGCLTPIAASAAEPASASPTASAAPAADTAPPVLGLDVPPLPASTWYAEATTATITATDADSGVGAISWTIDDGPVQTAEAPAGATAFSAPVRFARSGEYVLQFWASDRSGNLTWRRDHTVRVDVEGPALTVTTLAEGDLLRLDQAAPLDFSFADMHSGVDHWSAIVTGPSTGGRPVLAPPGSALPSSAPGTHTLTFRAADRVGHEVEAEMHYSVSDSRSVIATEPTVSVSPRSPRYNAPMTATVTVRAKGSASTPVGTVSLTIDGRSYRAALVGGAARIPITRAVGAGARTVKAVFTSAAPRAFANSTATARITVAKARPKVTAKLSKSSVSAGSRAKVAVRATLPGTLGAQATGAVAVYDGKRRVGTGRLQNGKAVVGLAKLKRGVHRLTARVAGNGNQSSATSASVRLRVR